MQRRTLKPNSVYIYEQPTRTAVTKDQVDAFVSQVMDIVQREFPWAHNYFVEANHDMLQVVVVLNINDVPVDSDWQLPD